VAVTLRHSFESGQVSGTTITGGNSATGGNAFDSITSGTGTVAAYNSTAYRASLSGLFSSAGTSAASSANWTTAIGTAVARAYGRTVINGSSFTVLVDFLRHRAAATQTFRLRINTSGKLEFRNSANSLLLTSTTTFSTGQWYLIRWDIPVGASVTGVVYIHTDPTTATAAETLTATLANFGTSNIDEANYGAPVSALASVASFRHDDILFTDQGLPGPPTQSITITDAVATAESLGRTLALSRAVADAVGTAESLARALAASRAAADAVTTADSPARALSIARSISDAVTTSDAATRSTALTRALADGFTTADVAGRTLLLPRALADGIHAGDVAGRAMAAIATAADAVTVADVATPRRSLSRSAADAVGLAEAISTSVVSRIVHRPNTGLVTRPTAGTVTRPNAGVVTRP
jgi:hypothetical protein